MEIFSNIKQELEQLSPVIASIPKNNLLTIPNGYFDNILDNILELIKNDPKAELEGLAPTLSSLPKENIFAVPDGYFDKQPFIPKILKNEAKIIPIKPKRKLKQAWLVAASVILLIGLGIPWWKSNNNLNKNNLLNEKALSEEIDKIDDTALTTYITNNTSITDPIIINTTTTNLIVENDISESIKYINEKEINQYFAENEYLALK